MEEVHRRLELSSAPLSSDSKFNWKFDSACLTVISSYEGNEVKWSRRVCTSNWRKENSRRYNIESHSAEFMKMT